MFDLYCAHLDISEEDLRWKLPHQKFWCGSKRILDLGSGYGQFARECVKRGIPDVYSLDCNPALFTSVRGTRQTMCDGRTILAQAEALPFRDETFDLVLAHDSVPALYTTTRMAAHAVLQEVCRILKRGGEARMVPWFSKDNEEFNVWMDEMLAHLHGEGGYRILRKVIATPEVVFGGRMIERDILIIQKCKSS